MIRKWNFEKINICERVIDDDILKNIAPYQLDNNYIQIKIPGYFNIKYK